MSKVLFFNPPSKENVYLSTNISVAAPSYPNLTLATLAGNIAHNHDVKILDLELEAPFEKFLFNEIENFTPDIIAASANTPDYFTVRDIMHTIKEKYPSLKTIVGGVHITALPYEASREKCFDFLVLGEGDGVISELLSASSPNDVAGIAFHRGGYPEEKIFTLKRNLINDLNNLPYPAWHLFELDKYKNSRISSRINPVGLIETSRGCAFQCNFCNKLTFGTVHRTKEPKRVVDEIEYMLKCGFKEIHFIDDSFTQNIGRAKEVCIEIIRRNLKFPWSLFSGVRVDMVDFDFFQLAKKSGCWQVAFGIESGEQNILDRINKRITLDKIENAVKLARKAGMDTFGFFILALSGETEQSMKRTIDFACKLPLDIAKFDICIPYPGTPYYNELKSDGRLISENWSKYTCHNTSEVLFNHPNLTWPTIKSYYKKAFRRFYLRPSYIMHRFNRSLIMGDLINDINYFLGSKW